MQPKFELLKDISDVAPGDVLIEYPVNGEGKGKSFDATDKLKQQKWEVIKQYDDGFELGIPRKELKMTRECGLWIEDAFINKKIEEMISEGVWWIRRKAYNE